MEKINKKTKNKSWLKTGEPQGGKANQGNSWTSLLGTHQNL